MRTLSVFVLVNVLSGTAWAQDAAFTLNCNVTDHEVTFVGRWTDNKWKGEKTTNYTEAVEIDLNANTWITRKDMESPRPIASVSDKELVLFNFTTSKVNRVFRINRISGAYLLDSKYLDGDKNESVTNYVTGTCKKADEGRQQF